ncbi:MAG TPA: DNA mismatch repair protein MutS, partial [bacterium]|nr:DNA mismatch repair protein MutS [bacterium]
MSAAPEAPGFPPYASLTPIMQQYVRLKAKAPDCLLFFRLGDFYELFGPDAEAAGTLLGLTVTSRDKDKHHGIPMAGVPHHAAQGYLARLLELGHRVAIAEQLQDPASTKGMVDRDIVRILSPGTVLEEDLLAAPKGNYLAVLSAEPGEYGLALVELSTGTVVVATEPRPADEADFEGQHTALDRILSHAHRFDARELLSPASLALPGGGPAGFAHGTYLPHGLGAAGARERIARQLRLPALGPLDLGKSDAACCAVAEALRVVERLAPAALPGLTRFTLLARDGYLELDASALKNLEVLANAGTGRTAGSLLGVLDKTKTPMGRRLLREALTLPLRDPAQIEAR